MSTQQDIYAVGVKTRLPILNKGIIFHCLQSSRYAKSRPNEKLIYNSIMNGPYVRRMIRQPEVNKLRAERLARAHDPLALMANSNNPYNNPVFHQDQPSPVTYMQQPQPSFNMNYMQQPMPNPEDIIDPTTAMNMTLFLMAKAFKLNYSTPTNNNQRISSNHRNRQIAQPGMDLGQDRQMQMVGDNVQNLGVQNVGNQNGLIVILGIANPNANQDGNGNVVVARDEVRPRKRDVAYLQTQLLIAQKEEAGIQLQAEEFDFMATIGDLDEIEEVNANCILMANLQQTSTSGTQIDKALVYDSDGSAENDNNVIFVVSSVEQSGRAVEQHYATIEETRAYFESIYNNLAIEAEKVNTVNRKMKETNADLTTQLARYKNQEKCFEFNQEKYEKLERCYQKSIYQEQCLTKKINALHLSSDKTITTLNEEIANLNNQLSKEKSTVSSLQEEKKKLKSDFKIRKEKLLDKQIQLENKIKELDNILVKTGVCRYIFQEPEPMEYIPSRSSNKTIVEATTDADYGIHFVVQKVKLEGGYTCFWNSAANSVLK
ncbi:hypothetical protein Tco_0053376 [Tanacetum coccineum]